MSDEFIGSLQDPVCMADYLLYHPASTKIIDGIIRSRSNADITTFNSDEAKELLFGKFYAEVVKEYGSIGIHVVEGDLIPLNEAYIVPDVVERCIVEVVRQMCGAAKQLMRYIKGNPSQTNDYVCLF